jgi:hypothetical protein
MRRWDLRRVLLALVLVWAALLAAYVAANLDFGWVFRDDADHFRWPDLPLFRTTQETNAAGQPEVLYTVPTRQLTPSEISELRQTNAATGARP